MDKKLFIYIVCLLTLTSISMFTLGTKYKESENLEQESTQTERESVPTEPNYEEIQIDDSILGQLYKLNLEKQRDIIETGRWDHTNGDGTTYKERVQHLNGTTSENLYRGYTCDIRFAIQMWNESPTHLENMNRDYDAGIITIQRVDENTCYINFVHNKKGELDNK